MVSLTKLATKGIMWTGVSQITMQILSFTVTLILARLLLPEDFGLIGMSSIFIGVILTFNELGLSAGLVQRKDLDEKHINACFWISIAVGVLLCLLTLIISPLVAQFFNEPLLDSLLKASSIIFVLGSLMVVPQSLMTRDIKLKELALAAITSEIIGDIVAIISALSGFGVWSLVFKTLTLNLSLVVIYWLVHPWRPSPKLDLTGFKEIFNFSSKVMGTNIVSYANASIDPLLIGKMLGSTQLGFYSVAVQMVSFPMRKVSSIMVGAVFPVFSRVQDDHEKLRKGYLKATRFISILTFPAISGLFIVAPEFITLMLGPKWLPAIMPLRILSIAGFFGAVFVLANPIFLSKGRSDLTFKFTIITLIISAIAIFFALPYGINGVAAAVTLVGLLMGIIRQILVNKLIDMSTKDFIKSIQAPLISSTIMVIVIYLFRHAMRTYYTQNDLIILMVSIITGVLAYLLALRLTHENLVLDVKEIIVDIRSKDG
jgi:O-antigen/teichoic acid export membrane protein